MESRPGTRPRKARHLPGQKAEARLGHLDTVLAVNIHTEPKHPTLSHRTNRSPRMLVTTRTPRLRRLLAPAFVLAASAALLSGCDGASAKMQLPTREVDTTVGVRVATPETTLAAQLVRATGRLEARNEAQVSAKVSGTVSALLVDIGDTVKKGQPLVRLDATQAALAVEQARAAQAVAKAGLDVAEVEFERAKKLRESGGVSQAGFDRAEAAHKQALAGYKQATAALRAGEQALADHTIRAPFDGVVTARHTNVGEFISPAMPVFELVDVEDLEVVLPVPETVVAAVQPGAIVRGSLNPSGERFEAEVRTVSRVVNPEGRTVEVRAKLVGDRSPQMRPHAIVDVDFAGESLTGLFIPSQALREQGDERFVWLVEGDQVQRRPVRVEPLTPGVVRVLEGLQGDEQVVTDVGSALAAGMKVQVLR